MPRWTAIVCCLLFSLAALARTEVTVQVFSADGLPLPAQIGVGTRTLPAPEGERLFRLQPGTHTILAVIYDEEIREEIEVGEEPFTVQLFSRHRPLLLETFTTLDSWSTIEERPANQPTAIPLQDRDPKEMGMVAIQGAEWDSPHHIVSLYSDTVWEFGDSYEAAFARVQAAGGLAIWAHPRLYKYEPSWYIEHFKNNPVLIGMEAYDSGGSSLDIWDKALTGLMPHRPVWGFGADDLHHAGQLDQVWNLLLIPELNPDQVRQAIEGGQVLLAYRQGAGSLPIINSIEVTDTAITIHASGSQRIRWISDGLEIHTGPELNYADHQIGSYLRAEVIGTGGRVLTQPWGFIGHELVLDPYARVDWSWEQHKVQLHAHTTLSDGFFYPHQVVDMYQSKGYSALALTDHNRVVYPWNEFTRWESIDLPYLEDGKLILPNPRARLTRRGIWVTGETDWEDYAYIVNFKVTTPISNYQYARFPFRIQGAYQYYEVSLEHRLLLLRRHQGDQRTDLVTSWSTSIRPGVNYTLEIVVRGNHLLGYLNGAKIFDVVDDAPLLNGKVGLRPDQNMLVDSLVEIDRIMVIGL